MTTIDIERIAAKHNLLIDRYIAEMIAADAVIAFGISGGKDGEAAALAASRFLNEVKHQGPRVLIHADLGEIEHRDSLLQCRRLADRLGLELIVVRRKKGGMIERWYQRWHDNVTRHINLSCVTLITPWSSASMRYCTGELKTGPITRELATRFHGLPIINCIGIRGQESDTRASKPSSKINEKLFRAGGLGGRDWHLLRDWSVEEVWLEHERSKFPRHFAYLSNGNLRVSCSVCVLAGLHDLRASQNDERNHPAYRKVVGLEIISTFSFQPSRWLGDVRPDLLSREELVGLERAKEVAQGRREVEARIPKEMLFDRTGWPKFIPSMAQCEMLAEVRLTVGRLVGLPVLYTTADAVLARYTELFAEKERKLNEKARKIKRKISTAAA